jgi:hypothetical protein
MPRWSTLVVRTLRHVNRPAGGAVRPWPHPSLLLAAPFSSMPSFPRLSCWSTRSSSQPSARRRGLVGWNREAGLLEEKQVEPRVTRAHSTAGPCWLLSFHAHANPLAWPLLSRMWTRFGCSPLTATCKRDCHMQTWGKENNKQKERERVQQICMRACSARTPFLWPGVRLKNNNNETYAINSIYSMLQIKIE